MTSERGEGPDMANRETGNGEFLAAALHWLRLRLAWYAAEQQAAASGADLEAVPGSPPESAPGAAGQIGSMLRPRLARPGSPTPRGGAAVVSHRHPGHRQRNPHCSRPRRWWRRRHRPVRAQANGWPQRRRS